MNILQLIFFWPISPRCCRSVWGVRGNSAGASCCRWSLCIQLGQPHFGRGPGIVRFHDIWSCWSTHLHMGCAWDLFSDLFYALLIVQSSLKSDLWLQGQKPAQVTWQQQIDPSFVLLGKMTRLYENENIHLQRQSQTHNSKPTALKKDLYIS